MARCRKEIVPFITAPYAFLGQNISYKPNLAKHMKKVHQLKTFDFF